MQSSLPCFDPHEWIRVTHYDPRAVALADRHYSRHRPGATQVGGPFRKLVLVTRDSAALWITTWPAAGKAWDNLDAWRCQMFRNEGTALASSLILAAMAATAGHWQDRPADGWVTWVKPSKIRSVNPGYCFKQAGWCVDREYKGKRLVRLRAAV